MLRIGLKYCGGCNPHYDRVALVEKITRVLSGKVEFVAWDKEDLSTILVVAGCNTACLDWTPFEGRGIELITCEQDGDDFIRKISEGSGVS